MRLVSTCTIKLVLKVQVYCLEALAGKIVGSIL